MTITKKAQPKAYKAMRFVAEAVSDDLTRPMLSAIIVERHESLGLVSVATDGKRIHIVKLDELPTLSLKEGFYKARVRAGEIELDKIDFEYQFPNWRRAMPKLSTDFGKVDFDMCDLKEIIGLGKTTYKALALHAKTGRGFNIYFLASLFTSVWTMRGEADARKALQFENDTMIAVIMPMEPIGENALYEEKKGRKA